MQEIKKIGKKIVIIINKQDIASEEEIRKAVEAITQAGIKETETKIETIITGKEKEKELREEIVKKMKEEKMIR